MILTNYWKWLDGVNTYASETATARSLGIKNLSGTTVNLLTGPGGDSNLYAPRNSSFPYNLFVRVGTGTGEPTSSDYALGTDVTSSMTGMSFSCATTSNDSLKRTITCSGSNSTSSAITITEVGIGKSIYPANSSSMEDVLFAIVKLDTPVTVPGNGNFSITFDWTEA